MALYRYNARDRENRKYKGVKEAGSEAELVKVLLEDGLYCCSLKNEERTASMKHFTVPLKLLPPLCSQVSSKDRLFLRQWSPCMAVFQNFLCIWSRQERPVEPWIIF